MSDSLNYRWKSGKPFKAWFFVKGFVKTCFPSFIYRKRKEKLLQQLEKRKDKDYILERVEYYNKAKHPHALPSITLHKHNGHYYHFLDKIHQFKPSTFHKAYYLDLQDAVRYFDSSLRISYIPGDVYFTPEYPSIVKSRLLSRDNQNSILLKLDKLRHFIYVNDKIPFEQKKNQAIFRGKIRLSRQREQFLKMYFGSAICDCGIVEKNSSHPQWITPKKTISEHLEYKFIMALEGNDVASNLKWVMSSNSIAVMPRPTCETWFMEGKLIPNYHYIEIKEDLSDLEERLNYYICHPLEALEIIDHAHEYIQQFMDEEREEIIQLLVMDKYFKITAETSPQREDNVHPDIQKNSIRTTNESSF